MVSRRQFLIGGFWATVAAGLAAKGIFVKGEGDTGTRSGDELRAGNEPLPYLPATERLNPEVSLPADVIESEDLWKSYHTRVWSGDETKLFLRPGIDTVPIFQDLKDRKIESLDIVLFDDVCNLSEEQRANMDPGLVKEFDDFLNEHKSFPTGLFLGYGGHFGIFIAKSSMEQTPEHLLESYPDTNNDWIATYHTPAIILRHEWNHYNYINFSSNPEEAVGADIVEEMRSAEARLKLGDDSGYCVVYEIKEGVVVS